MSNIPQRVGVGFCDKGTLARRDINYKSIWYFDFEYGKWTACDRKISLKSVLLYHVINAEYRWFHWRKSTHIIRSTEISYANNFQPTATFHLLGLDCLTSHM